ncbi:hypothetical protein GCM10009804_03050 [Kribbella hippodromi]|uniref:HNH endonuclease n=1 Tax=Kribbella hippodromi TaxID=434347 RepID=A0ABP4MXA8_9ACTN
MPNPQRRGGRRAQRLAEYVIRRDLGVCWLCGHGGADTADHVIPVAQRPDLEYDVRNLRAAHGTQRTISTHGYQCQGNYGRGDAAAPTTSTHSRSW